MVLNILYLPFDRAEQILPTSHEVWVTKNASRVVLPRFMKAIHVKLSNEAIDLLVSKKLRQNNFLHFIDVLDDKIFATGAPEDNLRVFFILIY